MFSFQESCRAKLHFLRQAHNLSLEQLAELLGFKSKGSVADLESGKASPTFPILEKVVQIFAVSPDWLFGLTDRAGDDDAMFDFQKSCRKKLRLLRETYRLSTSQESELLGFKNKSSIAQIETGVSNPTLASLDDVVNIFSVSLDWLARRVNSPYRDEIIAPIEAQLIAERDKEEDWLAYYRLMSSWLTKEDIYDNPELRRQTFSLPVRANIIFALQLLRHHSRFFHSLQFNAVFNGCKPSPKPYSKFSSLFDALYSRNVAIEGKRKTNIRWNLCLSCYDLLVMYIQGRRTDPFFDICKEC